MKRNVILPTMNEEIAAIRKHPQKTVDYPSFSKQKVGIIAYSCMILFVMVMFFAGAFLNEFNWSFYLLLFLPFSYSHDLFNIFAVEEDGLLSGSRFIPWKNVKSFHFVPIDVNHKYYGYSKEVNNGYELKIKAKFFPISCIVTSNEMKEKLSRIISEYAYLQNNEKVR